MKYVKSFLISLFFQLFLIFALGKKNLHDFTLGQFINPDSYYTMDLIYQHQVNHAILGSNPMILESHMSWIHWSSLYLYLINAISCVLEIFLPIGASIQYAGALCVIIPSFVFGFVFSLFMLSYKKSIFFVVFFEFLFFINEYIMGYDNIMSLTHHTLMICVCGLFLLSTLTEKPKYYLSGLLATLALWVSPEIFPVILSGLGVYAFRCHNVCKVSFVWFVSSLIIILIDKNPPVLSWYSPDRLDLCYVILAGLISISTFFFKKDIILLIALSVATALWMIIIPHLHEGVHGFIPVDIYEEWYKHVSEIARTSINLLFFEKMFIYLVIYIGMLFTSFKSYKKNHSLLFLYLSSIPLIYLGLGLMHGRSMLEFIIVFSVFGSYIFKDVRLLDNLYIKACLCSLVIGTMLFIPSDVLSLDDTTCEINDTLPYLKSDNLNILSPIDDAPKLLWITRDHKDKTFAGPYHRDIDSMRSALTIFRAYKSNPDYLKNLELLDKYHVNYILTCPKKMDLTGYFPWKHFDFFKGFLDTKKLQMLPKTIHLQGTTPSGWIVYKVN